MIPKIIHYCWFGKKPKPVKTEEYILSWKKYCPDYEIREWNESNFDINENAYCREAYEAKNGLLFQTMFDSKCFMNMVAFIWIQM